VKRFIGFLRLKSPLVQPDINGNPVKYLVYSAHDTTLSAALVAMDAWDDVQPYYASGYFSSACALFYIFF